jgi:hypothetical protein
MERVNLDKHYPPRVVLNETTWCQAQEFILSKWKERAAEYQLPIPTDLSMSCKFSSLFVQRIFGGFLQGNLRHVFNEIDGNVHDLNASAMDVLTIEDPHEDDSECLYDPEYIESLESCLPRVNAWTKEFLTLAKRNDWTIRQEPTSSLSPF